jgi:tetratricopeptide (TPR) repeat protein
MRRILCRLAHLVRRPWLVLAVLVLGGGLAVLAGPHLVAWYHWRAAQADLERYHSKAALRHLNACLEAWPKSARTHLLAARAARRIGAFDESEQTGAFDEAERHLRECERLDPDTSAETDREWALLRATTGDLSEQVESFLLLQAEKKPDLAPLVWEALAQGYDRMYRVYEAFLCLERWLAREPDNVQALFIRGNVWRHMQKLHSAVPDYRRVVELDEEHDEARWWLALGLLEAGRYEEALTHLEIVRPRRPADGDVEVRLARCRAGLGQLADARKLLDEVLRDHPGHAMALRVRGEVDLTAGLPDTAVGWLRQAATADPYDYLTQFLLFQALRQQGKDAAGPKARADSLKDSHERLSELMTSKMSAQPHDPALHCKLGTLLLSLGHRQLGERWLLSALVKDPSYQPAHVALAEYYQGRGDTEKAAEHRRQAELSPPPSPPARSASVTKKEKETP